MSDLIDRQDVIDLLQMNREEECKKSLSAECEHKSVIRSKHDAHVAFCDYLIECVKQLPTHETPSNTLGALDCVDRQAAIEVASRECHEFRGIFADIEKGLNQLPSVQPDIIACGDCKHWICHDKRCGYWNHGVKPLDWCCHAERRTDEQTE